MCFDAVRTGSASDPLSPVCISAPEFLSLEQLETETSLRLPEGTPTPSSSWLGWAGVPSPA
jgi:hypothetical protein